MKRIEATVHIDKTGAVSEAIKEIVALDLRRKGKMKTY